MKKMVIPAAVDRLDEINAFVDAELEACGCSPKAQMQAALAVEEIFVNIASYACNPEVGEAELKQNLDGVAALTLDMQKLDYLSSAGPRVLLAAQKQMNRQGSMVIRHVNETILEAFEVTGFIDILTVE